MFNVLSDGIDRYIELLRYLFVVSAGFLTLLVNVRHLRYQIHNVLQYASHLY
ncbi:hypothetical protein F6Y02_38040 (plasmid) [Bacillus megaterium]|nr:hypothetical protein [Priestia megaterium]